MTSFGHALPYDLASPSHDEADRNQQDGLVLATPGLLGFHRPLFLVPSWFYAGKGFLPATANHEFSKSGPRGDAVQHTRIMDRIKTQHLHPHA
jgi:hypothetical protein